jgi:hypothetical protein
MWVTAMTAIVVEMTFFDLTTQHRTAISTSHKSSERKSVLARPVGVMVMLSDNFLNIIKNFLRDQWRKVCLIGSGSSFYKTIVDSVLKHPLNILF